jgi:hypothetical protein
LANPTMVERHQRWLHDYVTKSHTALANYSWQEREVNMHICG